jgi:hypothetical protein
VSQGRGPEFKPDLQEKKKRKKERKKRAADLAQVVEHLPSQCKALSSNSSIAAKNNNNNNC